MSYGWNDGKNLSTINFLVSCTKGIVFLEMLIYIINSRVLTCYVICQCYFEDGVQNVV
jgi:hypothetical protein